MNWLEVLDSWESSGRIGTGLTMGWKDVLSMADATGAVITLSDAEGTLTIRVVFPNGVQHSVSGSDEPSEFLRRVSGGHKESHAADIKASYAPDKLASKAGQSDAEQTQPMEDGRDVIDG